MRLSYFLLALLIPGSVFAQTIPGYDVLGVAKYCKRFLKAPPLPAMSTLLNTFGDPVPCIRKRAALGGLQLVQVDLIDATCWRNGVCPPGAPRPDDLKVIKQRAGIVQRLAEDFPAVEFWASPALEHDVKDAAKVARMMEAAKAGCPKCKVINSPFTGAKPAQYKVELHGTKVKAFAISADGASSFDADNMASDGNTFQHRISGEYKTFMWWPELNLRCSGEKSFTQPLRRTEKPTIAQFEQAAAIVKEEPAVPQKRPAVCEVVKKIAAPEIYKPNAESYCNGQQSDPRGNKPLLIIKRKGNPGERLPVLDINGREVGCFQYYGNFPDIPGAFRYYMGNCSGETPAGLMADLGGEWGYVKTGAKECLLLNAVRRMGAYR